MSDSAQGTTQGVLLGLGAVARRSRKRAKPKPEPAARQPVAVVTMDLPSPALDRTFDYLVPTALDAAAQPGVRVRAPFHGRRVDGFIVERRDQSEHPGALSWISRVPSGLPLLTPGLWRLANAIAARQAGTVADVLRLAIPAAHVATEKRLALEAVANRRGGGATPGDVSAGGPWGSPEGRLSGIDAGGGDVEATAAGASSPGTVPERGLLRERLGGAPAAWAPLPQSHPLAGFVDGIGRGDANRVVWNCLPGSDLLVGLVAAILANWRVGRQALIVAPSERQVAEVTCALFEAWPQREAGMAGPAVARLVAGDGPEARLEGYWGAASGTVDVLVGTRAAAFAPLARPGLLVLVNDGDPALAEPRAPYPGARAVLTVRAGQERANLLVAGLARSVEAQALVDGGWMGSAVPARAAVRAATPVVGAPTADDLAREGATAASRLPEAAFRLIRRGLGAGPVLIQVPSAAHEVFGLVRTADELGRAFPGVALRRSGAGSGLIESVGSGPALVVATPSAEPVADGGYAAACLLDAGAWAGRPELDAAVEALRIWMGAAGLVRPRGEVLLLGSDGGAAAQALVRWDPVGLAERELAERRELGLPPATKAVVLTGPGEAVDEFTAALELPGEVRVRAAAGKTVLLIPLPAAKTVIGRIRETIRGRSAVRQTGGVRVKVDGELD